MEIILLRQICIMFIIMGIGIFLVRKGYITDQGSTELGTLLLRVVTPCVVVNAFLTEYSPERAWKLAAAFGTALLVLGISIGVSCLFWGRKKRVENFSMSFCNVGFVGIPLIQAVLGTEGVFYLTGFVVLVNILQWTYGILILTGDRQCIRLGSLAKNPVILSSILGAAIYFLRIPVWEAAAGALEAMAGLNTPVAMLVMGTYLAKVSWRELWTTKSAYLCAAGRLAVIPLLTLAVLSRISGLDTEICQVLLIGCSTPVGANSAIFADQYHLDNRKAVVYVCLSTLLCIITIPAFYLLAGRVIGFS